MKTEIRNVLITGGAGYVGAALVPKLLDRGYHVKVVDLYLYGDVLTDHPNLTQIKGDIRNQALLKEAMPGTDAVIHLACISNDPSYELDPDLGKDINFNAFEPLVDISRDSGVKRFIYASSSSVYGIKDVPDVTEDMPLDPLTDYSKYKALCEEILQQKRRPGFTVLTIRPATVCGYSPRLRLDLTVNILTNHAVTNEVIKVFGGKQMRPNLHIEDMVNLYLQALQWEAARIDGKIYNVGYHNKRVGEIAEIVKGVVGNHVKIITTPTDDNRSYHISSDLIKRELDFEATHTIEDAVKDLVAAFQAGKIPDSMNDMRYYNIKTMQALALH